MALFRPLRLVLGARGAADESPIRLLGGPPLVDHTVHLPRDWHLHSVLVGQDVAEVPDVALQVLRGAVVTLRKKGEEGGR